MSFGADVLKKITYLGWSPLLTLVSRTEIEARSRCLIDALTPPGHFAAFYVIMF